MLLINPASGAGTAVMLTIDDSEMGQIKQQPEGLRLASRQSWDTRAE